MSLEDFESIKRWLDSLRAQGCSEETFKQYKWGFPKFIDWIGMSPDELVKKRAEDMASRDPVTLGWAKDVINKFITSGVINKESGKPLAETTKKHIVHMVRSFLEENNVPVLMKVSTSMPKRERDYIPSREEIQQMVQGCKDSRDQVLIMILAETGMRIGTLVELRWKHVKNDWGSNNPPFLIVAPSRPTRRKRGGYDAFICDDAMYYLRRHLLGRQMADEDLIFGIDEATAINIVRRAGEKIGIVESQGLSSFRSHCFRKRLQSAYVRAGLEPDVVDTLMGHQPRGTAQADAYIRFDTMFSRQEYIKAISLVRVF